MIEPREKTVEEARSDFLDTLRGLSTYWVSQPGITVSEACNGLLFSVLCIFDGVTTGLPAIDLVLQPHPDDQRYRSENGENWYKPGMIINECMLHELWAHRTDQEKP